jgi:hypothetical protein
VTELLDRPPYGPRDEPRLLAELNALTRHHATYCPTFARIWPNATESRGVEDLPWLHVGLFKRAALRTDFPGARRGRTLRSSGTSGTPSRIELDDDSSQLQARSAAAILQDLLGKQLRPLLVLDRADALREKGSVSARLAAAMSLRPLASEIRFLLRETPDADAIAWDEVSGALEGGSDLLVYGFTSVLWRAWASRPIPEPLRGRLAKTRVSFVHSGGWKRLEEEGIDAARLTRELLAGVGPGSRVVDCYGLVEQIGILYPLCEAGFRHTPVWADVLVRDASTLAPLTGEPGMLQLVNVLARGAPCHSVLTEDLGRIVAGPCPCGRSGKRFELLGRVPKAELRGCANV